MKGPRVQTLFLLLISLGWPECDAYGQKPRDEARKITVAAVGSKTVTVSQQYVCRIKARRHIEVQSLVDGHLAAILVKEGQRVKRGDLLFRVGPPGDGEKPGAENKDKMVSIMAPFDGLIGRLAGQPGSLVQKGDPLTTLSDNGEIWAYFNVPESRYLEYMAEGGLVRQGPDIELILANHSKFPHVGKIGAIAAKFNAETGNIAFRADFPNPDGLLRHGQSGTVLFHREFKDAIVIPQLAAFEDLAERCVFVVDKDGVAHRRKVIILGESEDLFVIKEGVAVGDRIVVDGVKMVRDGDKVESKSREPKSR